MFNECLEIRWKMLIFASLISSSKIILFQKQYQAFDTMFHHEMEHLEVRQKYTAARRIYQLSPQCFIWWWNTAFHAWYITWNLAFPVFISPIVWNMRENLHYESVYFKELHNDQEYNWLTANRAGAAVV